jgi:hypothetical protein
MKMILKTTQKIGKDFFCMICLVFLYFLVSIGCYINSKFFDVGLHIQNVPLFVYLVQWLFIILLITGVFLLFLTTKSKISWVLINIGSLGFIIHSLCFYFFYDGCFYFSILNFPISSFFFLFFVLKSNIKKNIIKYEIHISIFDYFVISFIPMAIVIGMKYFLDKFLI